MPPLRKRMDFVGEGYHPSRKKRNGESRSFFVMDHSV